MGCKATETTHNIINTLAQELLTNVQYSDGLRSFAKETRALKRSRVASHWKLTMTNWEQSSKLILLQLCEKLLKNSTSTILWSFNIWSKLESWKSLISEYLKNWPKIKIIIVLRCHLLTVGNNEPFLDQDCDVWQKVVLYDNWWQPAQWLGQ